MSAKKQGSTSMELALPATSGTVVGSDDLSMIAATLVDQARGEGIALTGEGGLLPAWIAPGYRDRAGRGADRALGL